MTLKRINILIIFIGIIIFNGCKKEYIPNSSVDFRYFPLKVKSWIIYDVTEIQIDNPMNYDSTNHYQLKEFVDTFFYDNAGIKNYRIERFKRKDSTESWTIADVWYECLINNTVQRVEENIRYTKLCFPVQLNKSWNGNAYNTLEPEEYSITSIDLPASVNTLSFDSTLTVTQKYELSLIHKYDYFEKYAKNIGLIQKQIVNIRSDSVVYQVPIENRITRAQLYYQNIISYGGY